MATSQFDPLRKGTTSISQLSREQLLQPGDRVGHTRVIELIAAGGMANVYKVWHEQLEVVRAIKILKPGYTDESKGRLETEAKISANLRHPNIVEIYGMGYWNTIPYIEMEFVDGPSLKDLLETHNRLSVQAALAINHYLCVALQFAYSQDMTLYGKVYDRLIHRDLKPANILLTSKGVVKLADFGIARPSEVSIHTVGSKVMGTFAYLSPEQLNGEKLDQRSDIYALGTVLYEMISGVKTFPQRLLADLVQKKSKGQYAALNSMGIQIPKNLSDLIDKCLNLDKNKRYNDIDEINKTTLGILNKLTSKSPDIIIRSIASEPPADTTIQVKKKINWALMLTLFFVVLVIASAAFLLTVDKKTDQVDLRKDNVAIQPDETFTTRLPEEQTPPQHSSNQIPRKTEIPPVKSKIVSQPVQSSEPLYEKGLSAFNAGNYEDAISILSQIPQNSLDESLSKKIRLSILQSHFKLKHFDLLRNQIEQTPIEHPEYYLLTAQLYQQFKQFDLATDALKKALSFENSDSNIKFRIRYLKIRLSEEQYDLKPNSDNMKIMTDDYNAFLNYCCTSSSANPACKEIQLKLQQITN